MTLELTKNDNIARSENYKSTFDVYKRLTGATLDRQYVYDLRFGDSGIVVYCDYTGYSVTIHIHLPKQLKRNAIRTILKYPFDMLEVKQLFAEIKYNNHTMRKIAEKAGFQKVATLHNFYGFGDDKIIMVATREDVAKWIK